MHTSDMGAHAHLQHGCSCTLATWVLMHTCSMGAHAHTRTRACTQRTQFVIAWAQCLEGLWQALETKPTQMVVCRELRTCAPVPLAWVRKTLERGGVSFLQGRGGPTHVELPSQTLVASVQEARAVVKEVLKPQVCVFVVFVCACVRVCVCI